MLTQRALWLAVCLLLPTLTALAEPSAEQRRLDDLIRQRAVALEEKLISWRRDIHEHPELGEQEVRTAKLVADHLQALGLEVKTGVARTGVVGLLRGGKPGPNVTLRADMDALPVKEMTNLPFASKARGVYVGVPNGSADLMHACGHDAHTAILMTVAEVLAGMKDDLPGTVRFLFQPAEEGPSNFLPDGKKVWGAKMMVQEGALTNPKPAAVFGLHVFSNLSSGVIGYRPGVAMASSDRLRLKVIGRGSHGSRPWAGVDPITVAAQIQLGLQTIVSRQVDLTRGAAVITVGTIHGGTRYNIIPDSVEMDGTIRSFDADIRHDLHARIRNTAESIAKSAGATAEVSIVEGYDVTTNDPTLTKRMLPTLAWASDVPLREVEPTTGAEDFSFYGKEAPAFFFFLGITPKDQDPRKAPSNHSPLFYVDEPALLTGVRALAGATVDFLIQEQAPK